ncbi:unnamed protein product [Ambrosiozyma monospora]|uniref:Unnamed protein product n=1 Tax=Ambrosiozyma monospora TaxID=43982 RepID=A0ACB5TCU0_AMBMO|nr:unnamed protein product [Ambrosiozyma monospora]
MGLPKKKVISEAIRMFRAHNPNLIQNSTSFDEQENDIVYLRLPILCSQEAKDKLIATLTTARFKYKQGRRFTMVYTKKTSLSEVINFALFIPSSFYNSLNFVLGMVLEGFEILDTKVPSENALEMIGPSTLFNVQVVTRCSDPQNTIPAFFPFKEIEAPELKMYTDLYSVIVTVMKERTSRLYCDWCGSLAHSSESCERLQFRS